MPTLLVMNLAVSDALMGFYMITLAGVDLHYKGRYIENSLDWRHSALCQILGVIATISSEVSLPDDKYIITPLKSEGAGDSFGEDDFNGDSGCGCGSCGGVFASTASAALSLLSWSPIIYKVWDLSRWSE